MTVLAPPTDRQNAKSRLALGIALGPALIVALTAWFALPEQAGGYRLAKWGMLGWALSLLSFVLLVRLCAARPSAVRWPEPGWALGLFMVASVGLPSLSPALSPTHWPGALGLLSGLALFSVTSLALNTVAAARRASLAVLTLSGTVCALLVVSQAAGLRWLTEGLPTTLEFRSPGSLGNPNWAAAFLAPLAPMSLALAATSAASGWRKLHHANAALLALGTAATLSKGGLLSLAAGAMVYALLDPRRPRTQRRAFLGAMLAGALGLLLLAWHFDWCATAPWLRGRLFLWRVALWLASEHPLTGVGLAGYVAQYGPAAATLLQHDPRLFMPLSSVDFAHNDVLQFAAEGGVFSAAAFVLVGVQALRRATRREGNALARAAGAALAAIYVNGLADSPLRVPATFALFFFLLGWLAPAPPATPSTPVPRTRRGVGALLALVGLLSALQGIRYTAGHLLWTRGRDAFKDDRSAAAATSALTDLSRARFYLPEHGRIASHYTLALARAGQWHAAIEASRVTNSLHFDFDDQMLERDLEAGVLSPEDAIALWQNFAARYPQLLTPQLRLGDLYLERGSVAAATRAYQRVLGAPQDALRANQVREQARRKLRALASEQR
ncbi:MAG: O-antigen ligase family protein [Polyangiaceae bacterium]